MKTPINDGGPAFPSHITLNEAKDRTIVKHPGMSLRDWFAGQALAAIVARAKLNSCGDFVADDCLLQHYKAPEYAAQVSYQFADAMLTTRKETP